MAEDHLSESEAEDLGARLEVLCGEFSHRQREFLKAALRLAAADIWTHNSEPLSESGIGDLIVEIQQADAAHAISRNPLPLPPYPKGSNT